MVGMIQADAKSRFRTASFVAILLFVSYVLLSVLLSGFVSPDISEIVSRWRTASSSQISSSKNCRDQCMSNGSRSLPKGIVSKTTSLEMRPLWGETKDDKNSTKNLFALPAGIKQKDLVNEMVTKFLNSEFAVMLFHYDGVVEGWREFSWHDKVVHVSARNQTKWFAKRFLHPDVVAEYHYIFLWDEDLGVRNFDPKNYVQIVEKEGLEISQPALDPKNSDIHQQITARTGSSVHRRTIKKGSCFMNSTAPPCTGWVEMMAPVFSNAAWRCVWYMIQNDLIHAWGLDYQLGYCANGDRRKTIGVVDAEYIVHYGRPTLGEINTNPQTVKSHRFDSRLEVRRKSYKELAIFKERWKKAVAEDECWVDPYVNNI